MGCELACLRTTLFWLKSVFLFFGGRVLASIETCKPQDLRGQNSAGISQRKWSWYIHKESNSEQKRKIPKLTSFFILFAREVRCFILFSSISEARVVVYSNNKKSSLRHRLSLTVTSSHARGKQRSEALRVWDKGCPRLWELLSDRIEGRLYPGSPNIRSLVCVFSFFRYSLAGNVAEYFSPGPLFIPRRLRPVSNQNTRWWTLIWRFLNLFRI